MIGKTIICFFKRNILYFLGQNKYFFQHLHKNGCVCMCQEKGGGRSPQRGLTCAETRKSGEGYGSCVLMGFRLQLTIPPLPRVLIFYKPSASCKHELNYNPFER